MKKYENIIDTLLNRQNDTPDFYQKNTYSKEQYRKLLDDVLKILKKNKDADIDEIRQKLYENSGIESLLKDFFLKRKKAPGAVINIGVNNYQERIVIGNSQEVEQNQKGDLYYYPINMKEDSLFDLASLTKLFTSVAILQLAGNCELRLDEKINKYLPQFNYLGDHTIYDLLTYQPYYTERRIDSATNIDEAEKILFNAKPSTIHEYYQKDRYNDIAPMILKYIVEKVSGKSFYDYIKENILEKADMNNTFVKVPEELNNRIVNFNYNYSLLSNGQLLLKNYAKKGLVTDSKAVALGQKEGKLPGHAGLFSTCDDIAKFNKGLINGKVLHPALTKEMAKNRTGVVNSNLPYYGFLCDSKHPNKYISDMHQGLSGSSLSKSGWTGTYVAIDPINNINLTFLSNRVHNRLVTISEEQKYRLVGKKDKVLNYFGKEIIDSSLYGYERRKITEACLSLALQEKMLEEIIGEQKEKKKVKILK